MLFVLFPFCFRYSQTERFLTFFRPPSRTFSTFLAECLGENWDVVLLGCVHTRMSQHLLDVVLVLIDFVLVFHFGFTQSALGVRILDPRSECPQQPILRLVSP